MATIEEQLSRIEQRLDLIAQLLLMASNRDGSLQITDQIAILADRGMSPTEIGKVIGRKANYVSVMTKRKKKNA